ncbi:hypothetical protein [Salmonella phage SD-1_S14]|nr:hypothetical protein [Salmonella phage SD-1_S14]
MEYAIIPSTPTELSIVASTGNWIPYLLKRVLIVPLS